MTSKTFEVRDHATFMPALAVRLDPACEADRYLLARSGFGRDAASQGEYIVLYFLEAGGAEYDPFAWPSSSRTRHVAHEYIRQNFEKLASGAVIDVEFIEGERTEPKVSESVEHPSW